MVDISVIIVTRNTRDLTCAAIQSVLESRDDFAREIVVVDNGSNDQTAAAVASRFPTVKYLRFEKNLGFAGANNIGAKAARGELLLLLNSDARLQPDSLSSAVAWIRAHPECAAAGAQLLNPDGSRQNSIANFPSFATELLNKSLLRALFPRRFPGKEHPFTNPTEVESVIGAFLLIRRHAWETLGGLDERYFFFFEETDFCLRVRQRGWKVFHLPQVRVWHDQGQSAKQASVAARIEYWRSRYRYFRKNHGPLTLGILSVGLWFRLLLEFIFSAMATLLTAGQSTRYQHKFALHRALVLWHCQGCPSASGLHK